MSLKHFRNAPFFALSPTVLLLFVWMAVPLAMTLYFSVVNYNLLIPGEKTFVGLENYSFFLSAPGFKTALWNSFLLTASTLVITIIGGTLIALALDRPAYGGNVALLLALAPFFIMPTVSALIWKNMFLHPQNGLFAHIAMFFGAKPYDFFAEAPLASVIGILSWQWLPFATLIIYTALQSLDRERMEAAEMDGAGAFMRFYHITLPHLSRPIAVAGLIETIFFLAVFAEIAVTTNGGPGDASTNLTYLVYAESLLRFDVGAGSAGGIVAVIFANIIGLILLRLIGTNRRSSGAFSDKYKDFAGRFLSAITPSPGKGAANDNRSCATMKLCAAKCWLSFMLRRFLCGKIFSSGLVWTLAALIFFPVFWTLLTSFKPEAQAVATPPIWFAFDWTLENYVEIFRRSDYFRYFLNSVILALGSATACLAIAVPAAWSMAFFPTKRTRGLLVWALSTKMLPPVGALMPVYLLFKDLHLLDNAFGLTAVMTLVNLPIAVWMLYSYFCEIPSSVLEAARMDGASPAGEMLRILAPMAAPGIASCFLLNVILAWNECFWTLNLTASDAAPLSAFIASYSAPEGLFYAKLSAASVLAAAPVTILGWRCRKQLVRGLTFGAVK